MRRGGKDNKAEGGDVVDGEEWARRRERAEMEAMKAMKKEERDR